MKKKSKFFDVMRKNYGNDFLTNCNQDSYRRYANMFFKDLAYGNIDKVNEGKYLLSSNLLMGAMIDEADSKLFESISHSSALMMFINAYPYCDDRVKKLYNKDSIKANNYNIIKQGLTAIQNTAELTYLDWICYNLKATKYYL